VELVRQCENDVEVTRFKKLLLTRLDPSFTCLGLTLVAMPVTAAVVGDGRLSATVGTNIDMAAKRCGTAACDGLDRLELLNSQGMPVNEVVGL
jgi:hypothetical protein